MKLKKWLLKEKISAKQFATLIPANHIYLYRIINHTGDRNPSYRFAKKIEKLTNGEVTVEELIQCKKRQ